jgi:GNAT superfamily N-acetyltransferase
VDLDDDALNRRVMELQRLTFQQQMHDDKLRLNTQIEDRSTYMGAFVGEELVSFVGFMAADMRLGHEPLKASHVGWAATHPDHRRKGLFLKIVRESLDHMRGHGVKLAIGFPNEISHRLLVEHVGFFTVPMQKVRHPLFPLVVRTLTKGQLPEAPFTAPGVYSQNDRELIDLKTREYGDAIQVFEVGENLVWGLERTRSWKGLRIPYFEVGGLTLVERRMVYPLLSQISRATRARYIEIVGTATNTYFDMFRFARPAPLASPFIALNLDCDATVESHFNVFAGLMDAFPMRSEDDES